MPEETTTAASTANETSSAEATSANGAAESSGESRTFTQADVDRIVGKFLEETRAKFGDYDEIKGKLKATEEQVGTLTQERDKAVEKLGQTDVRLAVIAEAHRAGAVDPEDVLALLPGEAVQLKDGKVVGVQGAVRDLATAKPHLFRRPGGGDGGARASVPRDQSPSGSMNDLIRRAAQGG